MPKNKKNNKDKIVVPLYLEKQKSNNTCRVHAINNALGRSILSLEKYNLFSFKIQLSSL